MDSPLSSPLNGSLRFKRHYGRVAMILDLPMMLCQYLMLLRLAAPAAALHALQIRRMSKFCRLPRWLITRFT